MTISAFLPSAWNFLREAAPEMPSEIRKVTKRSQAGWIKPDLDEPKIATSFPGAATTQLPLTVAYENASFTQIFPYFKTMEKSEFHVKSSYFKSWQLIHI